MPVYYVEVGLNPEGEAPPGGEVPGEEERPGPGFFSWVADTLGVSEQTALWIMVGAGALLLILLLRR